MKATQKLHRYFDSVSKGVESARLVAESARRQGYDPEERVDTPIARNMVERVVGLISIVAPELVGSTLIPRIKELEEKYGVLDWRVALSIAEEVASGKFCKFKDKLTAIEIGVRTGFTYHTLGIVAAPMEGFIGLKVKKRRDGKEYLSANFAGPIRAAGGTAAAFCVVLIDHLRKRFGYERYDPTPEEINRYVTEIGDYHERGSNLQYFPSQEEIRFLVEHIPVEINGDPTEEIEVSNYKDLPRVETNRIRGGICLVLAEGVAQKAPKLWKRLSIWGKDFDLEWDFLQEFIKLQKQKKADGLEEKTAAKISPNLTFIADLVAGRPILTHPLRNGGFRLRYGRCRVSGYSAASIHPATQYLLDKFIAIGTQFKVERPGKACVVTLCDTIDGPTVKLEDSSVKYLGSASEARECANRVTEIIYLGDILFNFGDFFENNQVLVPAGYCHEWWLREVEKACESRNIGLQAAEFSQVLSVDPEKLQPLLQQNLSGKPDWGVVKRISDTLNVPLHPFYTPYWKSISMMEIEELIAWLQSDMGNGGKIVLPVNPVQKRTLELLGIQHSLVNNEFVVIEPDYSSALRTSLGLANRKVPELLSIIKSHSFEDALSFINSVSDIKIRDKCGTFIGARMGRPEKSKMRRLTGSPHVLFPVGSEGGKLRSLQSALASGKVTGDFAVYWCDKCQSETYSGVCDKCWQRTARRYFCRTCNFIATPECPGHGKAHTYKRLELDIRRVFNRCLERIGYTSYPDLIKGVRGTSNKDHIPEHLIKGILRAKYNLGVNKDGTTRYDMTELPVTHFLPREIGTPVSKLLELGYETDIYGEPLKSEEQTVELLPQDIILPANTESLDEDSDVILFRVAQFIDELLVKLYRMEPFYNLKTESDLVGHLVIGLAPHISAGTVGRIIGFSKAQGCYAHPLWHAALRRDCDGDECSVILLMDTFLNFSRQFLPDKRGGRTMDAPLVLTTTIIPSEVDDMVHGLDMVWKYPLDFYEAALEYKPSSEVKIPQLNSYLNTERQYEGFGFTHATFNINEGVTCSAYKIIPTMEEKLKGQMRLAEKIRAVDETDVARLVIEKHFLKDIKGNLRKFSKQEFRCIKCNEKYRRPPLQGRCAKCSSRLVFTVSEGTIVKYLEPSISLAEKYSVSVYLRQTLELTRRRIDEMFGKEKERQSGLGKWFA